MYASISASTSSAFTNSWSGICKVAIYIGIIHINISNHDVPPSYNYENWNHFVSGNNVINLCLDLFVQLPSNCLFTNFYFYKDIKKVLLANVEVLVYNELKTLLFSYEILQVEGRRFYSAFITLKCLCARRH